MTHGTGLAHVELATSLLPSFKVTLAYKCVLTHVRKSEDVLQKLVHSSPRGSPGDRTQFQAWLKVLLPSYALGHLTGP